MIKPPSLSADHTLIWSGDPALNLPDDPEERERVLNLARETSQWQGLIREGETPTFFHCRPLFGTIWGWCVGEINRRKFVPLETAAFALRLALRRVENFGSYRVEHSKIDGYSFVTEESIDTLYRARNDQGEVGRDIVEELGGLVVLMAMRGLRPKS